MVSLRQTGRAGLQFMGDLQRYSGTVLFDDAKAKFYAHPKMKAHGEQPVGDRPLDELNAFMDEANAIAEAIPSYRQNRFYQRIVAEEIYNRGIPAAEEQRKYKDKIFDFGPPKGPPGTLTLNPDLEEPEYYKDVEWHLAPGGWDGHDLSMLMFIGGVSQYVFKQGGYAAVDIDADIFAQRMGVLDQLPKENYERIYEAGCGGTPTQGMLRRKFPDAELTGSDLSRQVLEAGHEMDKALGLNVNLKQEDSRYTSEPDNHYDAAVAYAVFHEMPDEATYETLQEMFRILKPGGDMLISDPGPIRALPPFHAVLYDWETDNREEPHFGASIRRDLTKMLREIGFEDTREYAIGDAPYPWVTLGRKPE